MQVSSSDKNTDPNAFERLHPSIQRWIWKQGWNELRYAQQAAVAPIMEADCDVLITSPTASGKTEAALFPVLSAVARQEEPGLAVLQVFPLKALINDQYRRLEELCEPLELPVTRWHGDAPAGPKKKLLKSPKGILLITPESLESILVNHGHSAPKLFKNLAYIIVDELHAFIGSERGRQLQSLLHRVSWAAKRQIPRIGLSATIGDVQLAARFLRPDESLRCEIINYEGEGQGIKLQLKGYIERPAALSKTEQKNRSQQGQETALEEVITGDYLDVGSDIYRVLRGQSNLVFANRKMDVELYADLLRRRCEKELVPNEFFAHHGNLSRELREDLEDRLKAGQLPTTAVATSTLELGIDIGSVASVAQIGAPSSVSGLRQRLGRSGRRGEPAILRLYIQEADIEPNTPLLDRLRVNLVQSIAVIELLLKRWCEPPQPGRLHFSTLIQQLLSLIAQNGGIAAKQAWQMLCATGPFNAISQDQFIALLRSLGKQDYLQQSPDGTLIHGEMGERIVNDYRFYTAFSTFEEYRLEYDGRQLGQLPIDYPLYPGAYIIFAGRRWEVIDVDDRTRVVWLKPSPGGIPPKFGGSGAQVHDTIRSEMRAVYAGKDYPIYLDKTARRLLDEARSQWTALGLNNKSLIVYENDCWIFPWKGDQVLNALAVLCQDYGMQSQRVGPAVHVQKGSPEQILDMAQDCPQRQIDPVTLAGIVKNRAIEKYDLILPDDLSCQEYAARAIDLDGALKAINEFYDKDLTYNWV